MKTFALLAILILAAVGCGTTDDSLEPRATREEQYPHSEPYSKEQRETIDESAGAQSQSREGIENPFLEPKAKDGRQVAPVSPVPPQ